MKKALIIHGTCDREEYFSDQYPSLSNSHWLPWLQKQLLIAGYETQAPEMPHGFLPRYTEWKAEFEQYSLPADSICIGHSCGAGFLLRWLSENHIKLARLVLVAPWIDPSKTKDEDFFNFNIDSKLLSRMEGHLFTSDNDSADVMASVKVIRSALPEMNFHFFPGMGHFCYSNMKSEKFPELKNVALTGKK